MPPSEQQTSDTQQMQCKLCHKVYPANSGWLCPDDNGDLVPMTADPLIGVFLDKKYEMLSRVGEGGMSVVYKARHRYMDRIVAVKLLNNQLVGDPIAVQRFAQESKAASSLTHQNIVAVHDFGFTDAGQAYFVMDYIDGESLADVLDRERRLPLDRAVNIFVQICDGLQEAHRAGLIHRDLKPSNVVLLQGESGLPQVKIVDFGLAKFLPRDDDDKPRLRLTQTGEVYGSPIYMSPEQCQGLQLDARSDIYSLGCLMYETLAGLPPFDGDNFVAVAVKHINSAPPAMNEVEPTAMVPDAVSEVVMKCLLKEPENRFQSAAEVRQALLDAASFCGVTVATAGSAQSQGDVSTRKSTPLLPNVSVSTKAVKPAKHHFSIVRFLLLGMPAIILVAGLAFVFLWEGPAGDHGTPASKLRWQMEIYLAQQAVAAHNYEQAKSLLLNAESLARKFGDGQDRLHVTLIQLADVYARCLMYADQEKAIQQAHQIETHQLLASVEKMNEKLIQLADSPKSGVQLSTSQLETQALSRDVLQLSARLNGSGILGKQEALLRRAIKTYHDLGMVDRAEMADFDIALADCIQASQRLSEVRPLLVDALKIRRATNIVSSAQSNRLLIRSLLRLGQFDRDQSEFESSKPELSEALKLTEKLFGKDNALMLECLNSYSDLMRQMGCEADFKEYSQRAKSLGNQRSQ
jgi:serine/threonine protein kinase/tetratricopeptide (TPR) repeat protein